MIFILSVLYTNKTDASPTDLTEEYAGQFTSYSDGTPYKGWLGVQGYIYAKALPKIWEKPGFSVAYLGVGHSSGWIQIGLKNQWDDDSNNHTQNNQLAIFTEIYQNPEGSEWDYIDQDYISYKSAPWSNPFYIVSTGYQSTDPRNNKTIYRFDLYNSYSSFQNGLPLRQYWLHDSKAVYAEAEGEVGRSGTVLNNMGPWYFGTNRDSYNSIGYVLRLRNSTGGSDRLKGWELWDTTLSNKTTKPFDDEPYHYSNGIDYNYFGAWKN